MKAFFITGAFLIFFLQVPAQNLYQSIHAEQQDYYSQFGERNAGFYDSLSGFTGKISSPNRFDCQLQRIVFGFHPYWAGSDYLNYQWNLLSDLCYFSYEADPYTGDPVTYHDWLSDPAIDSAKAHGVKVHLCATLFAGHSTFFTSMASRQNLIENLVSLVQQRNADGINMDIEALPDAFGDSVTSFMRDLSVQFRAVLPLAKISIDLPAVDWGNSFNIDEMDPYIDFFFVMGYDYYWNGSSQAGPVSPLYSLTSGYDYSLSRTISALESAGINPEKFIMGIPYYGRQWKTQSNTIPSQILANGTALTYASIRNNSGGPYNPANYYWEPGSFSSCYIFFQQDSWNQCFIGLGRDLRKKYDIVNYRGLAGIGIWALGYDDGYPDLWQAIADKFSDSNIPLTYDTLYDSGGPSWNYYAGEDYTMTIDHGFNDLRYLKFIYLNLEEGYDSLKIYAGPDTTYPFLGGFSGDTGPGNFSSSNGAFTLVFRSDPMQDNPGWMAVYHNGSMGSDEKSTVKNHVMLVYPNPADGYVDILLSAPDGSEKLFVYDYAGRVMFQRDLSVADPGPQVFHLSLSGWPAGVYSIVMLHKSGHAEVSRIIIKKLYMDLSAGRDSIPRDGVPVVIIVCKFA